MRDFMKKEVFGFAVELTKGPVYIGPHGGKWADPKHTKHYEEGGSTPQGHQAEVEPGNEVGIPAQGVASPVSSSDSVSDPSLGETSAVANPPAPQSAGTTTGGEIPVSPQAKGKIRRLAGKAAQLARDGLWFMQSPEYRAEVKQGLHEKKTEIMGKVKYGLKAMGQDYKKFGNTMGQLAATVGRGKIPPPPESSEIKAAGDTIVQTIKGAFAGSLMSVMPGATEFLLLTQHAVHKLFNQKDFSWLPKAFKAGIEQYKQEQAAGQPQLQSVAKGIGDEYDHDKIVDVLLPAIYDLIVEHATNPSPEMVEAFFDQIASEADQGQGGEEPATQPEQGQVESQGDQEMKFQSVVKSVLFGYSFPVEFFKGKGFEVGHVSQRAGGSYKKVAPNRWERISTGRKTSLTEVGKEAASGTKAKTGMKAEDLTNQEVMDVLHEASSRGHQAKSELDRWNIWSKTWEDLFGHLEMFRLPGKDIDPATVKVDLESFRKDPHAKGFITYHDYTGKQQTCSTVQHRVQQDEGKWKRIVPLFKKSKEIEAGNKKIRGVMNDKGRSTSDRDAAAVLAILAETGLRRGLSRNFNKTGNKGVAMLHTSDVTVDGDTVKFEFKGKWGQTNTATLTDASIARYVSERKKDAESSQRPFLFETTDARIDRTLKDSGSPLSTPKDFRTLKAMQVAYDKFGEIDPPTFTTKDGEEMGVGEAVAGGQMKKEDALRMVANKIMEVASHVAEKMNNNPMVARESYLPPQMIHRWLNDNGLDQLVPAWMDPHKKWKESPMRKGLDEDEDGDDYNGMTEDEMEGQEEDMYMLPPWVLAYADKENKQGDLKEQPTVKGSFGVEVEKGFTVEIEKGATQRLDGHTRGKHGDIGYFRNVGGSDQFFEGDPDEGSRLASPKMRESGAHAHPDFSPRGDVEAAKQKLSAKYGTGRLEDQPEPKGEAKPEGKPTPEKTAEEKPPAPEPKPEPTPEKKPEPKQGPKAAGSAPMKPASVPAPVSAPGSSGITPSQTADQVPAATEAGTTRSIEDIKADYIDALNRGDESKADKIFEELRNHPNMKAAREEKNAKAGKLTTSEQPTTQASAPKPGQGFDISKMPKVEREKDLTAKDGVHQIGQGAMGRVYRDNGPPPKAVKYGEVTESDVKIGYAAGELGIGPKVYGGKPKISGMGRYKQDASGKHIKDAAGNYVEYSPEELEAAKGNLSMELLDNHHAYHLILSMAASGGIEAMTDEKKKKVESTAVQVLQGMSKLHKAGFSHNDLHLNNVLISPEGKARIIDFGLGGEGYNTSLREINDVRYTAYIGHIATVNPDFGNKLKEANVKFVARPEVEKHINSWGEDSEQVKGWVNEYHDEINSILKQYGY